MFVPRATHLTKAVRSGVTVASASVAPLQSCFSSSAATAGSASPAASAASDNVSYTYKQYIRPYKPVASHIPPKHMPAEYTVMPAPGPGYVDSQGPTELGSAEGQLKLDNFAFAEPYYAQRAAIGPSVALPTKVHSTARDTLFTYSQRVYKKSLRTMRSMYIKQAKHRARLVQGIADREFAVIQAKKEQYRAWKLTRLEASHEREAENIRKRAAERMAHLARGAAARVAYDAKVLEQQSKKIAVLADEAQYWVTDPMDIKAALFDNIASVPVGWWPAPKVGADLTAPGYRASTNYTSADLAYLRDVRGVKTPVVKGEERGADSGLDIKDGDNLDQFFTTTEDERAYFDHVPHKFATMPAVAEGEDDAPEVLPTATKRYN